MDNDALMLEKLGDALTRLQVKYRAAGLSDRMLMRPSLEELLSDYTAYQLKLIKEGVISTDADLAEMEDIRQQINQAADTQQLMAAIAKTIAFAALKV